MNHLSSILILAALLWGSSVTTAQERPQAPDAGEERKPQMLEGRLIDLMCYTMDMWGDTHAKCALQCAQKGLPVGLLEEKGGKVYTVLLPSPGLAPHLEKIVRLTGKLHKENLLSPERMEVQEREAWKAVELPSAM